MDDYRVCRKIGSGAQGAVYEVCHLESNKHYAMKVMHCEDEKHANLALKEIKVLLQLRHSCIVSYVDFFLVFNTLTQLEELCASTVMEEEKINSYADTEWEDVHNHYCQERNDDKNYIANTLCDNYNICENKDNTNKASKLLTVCLVMELCVNGDMHHATRQVRQEMMIKGGRHPLQEKVIIMWLEQCASALQFMHEHGFIHRDIKPTNIFFDEVNNAKIGDFGLASASVSTEVLRPSIITTTRTALFTNSCYSSFTNKCDGTPYYLAPERIVQEQCTDKSDIWALGAVFVELITLHDQPLNSMILENAHATEWVMTNVMKMKFSVKLAALLRDMLHRCPESRPNAASIVHRLRRMKRNMCHEENNCSTNMWIDEKKSNSKPEVTKTLHLACKNYASSDDGYERNACSKEHETEKNTEANQREQQHKNEEEKKTEVVLLERINEQKEYCVSNSKLSQSRSYGPTTMTAMGLSMTYSSDRANSLTPTELIPFHLMSIVERNIGHAVNRHETKGNNNKLKQHAIILEPHNESAALINNNDANKHELSPLPPSRSTMSVQKVHVSQNKSDNCNNNSNNNNNNENMESACCVMCNRERAKALMQLNDQSTSLSINTCLTCTNQENIHSKRENVSINYPLLTHHANEIHVPEECESITHALNMIHQDAFKSFPSCRIIVAAQGVYKETLYLTSELPENVQIIGLSPPPQIEVRNCAMAVHCCSGKGLVVNLNIRHAGNTNCTEQTNRKLTRTTAVLIESKDNCQWEFNKCQIESVDGSGITIGKNTTLVKLYQCHLQMESAYDCSNTNSSSSNNNGINTDDGCESVQTVHPIITNCMFVNIKAAAIVVGEGAGGLYERNTFTSSGFAAFLLKKSSTAHLRANHIVDGKETGIFCQDACGVIEHNNVSDNAGCGIIVKGALAQPYICHNQVRSNAQAGFFCCDSSSPIITQNEICCNGKAGILVKTHSSPKVTHNIISDGKEAGVYVFEGGGGEVSNNYITHNANAGVLVTTQANPHVSYNVIDQNAYEGLWVCKNGCGTFCRNDLRNNLRGCMDIEQDCSVSCDDNILEEGNSVMVSVSANMEYARCKKQHI